MTSCPRCGSIEVRIHGSRAHVDFAKRWGFFGRLVPRATPVALEVSCAHCLFAFVAHNDGRIVEAPLQTAHDDLARLKAGLSDMTMGKGRTSSDDEKPVPRLSPGPAPDPRRRQRR